MREQQPEDEESQEAAMGAWVNVSFAVTILSAVIAFSGVAGSYGWLAKLLCAISLVMWLASVWLSRAR